MAPVKLKAPPTANAIMVRGNLICDKMVYSIPDFELKISGILLKGMLISPEANENTKAKTTRISKLAKINIHFKYLVFNTLDFNILTIIVLMFLNSSTSQWFRAFR